MNKRTRKPLKPEADDSANDDAADVTDESSQIQPTDLAAEIGKRLPFASKRQEAYLNLVRTHARLAKSFSHLLQQYDLTDPKYNALRILQGEGKPMQVYQIAGRMVTAGTDVTRLVERLADDGLIDRQRADDDRRVVWVSLNAKGKSLLKKMEKAVTDWHEAQFEGFTAQELQTLNELLFRARHSQ